MASLLARETGFSNSPSSLEELCERLLKVIGDDGEHMLHTSPDLAIQSLLDQVADFVYIKDRLCRYVFANHSAVANIGMSGSEQIIGLQDSDLFEPKLADQALTVEREVLETGQPVHVFDHKVMLPDGRQQRLSTSKFPLRDKAGEVIGLIGISRDVTERRNADDIRRGHARLLEMIARGAALKDVLEALVLLVEDQLPEIRASIFTVDETGTKLRNMASPSLSPAYIAAIDNFEIGEKKGCCGTAAWRRAPVVVCDVLKDPLWEDYRALAQSFGFRSCWSTPILVGNGELLGTFALYGNVVREPSEREMELTAMATDLAGIAIERSRNEQRIHYMAHHDPLTGLANRALFWSQFQRVLQQAQREKRKVTVAYVDLDNFKQINDTFGHAAGDAVLKTLAERILVAVRASDLVVRLGGDEFALVFNNPDHDEAAVVRRLQHVRRVISEPISIDGSDITATCSMGVSFYPKDGTDPETLLASADRAMYDAKAQGRDALKLSSRETAIG